MLYCIKHSQMVKAYHGVVTGLFHLRTIELNRSQDPGERFDVQDCDFNDGWAAMPPPPFDLDEYIEREGNPPQIIEDDFAVYDYDVESDQIVTEVIHA